MTHSRDVVIIGAGAVGLSTALALARRGLRVTVLDRGQPGKGCSYGNAGLIVPGHALPLATPATLRRLPRLLLGRDRVLRLRPRPDPGLARWLLLFLRACRWERVRSTGKVLRRLALTSLEQYASWAAQGGFYFQQAGWLHLYATESAFHHARSEASLLADLGVPLETLSEAEVQSRVPALKKPVVGGIFFPQEASLEPYACVCWLAEEAGRLGVEVRSGVSAHGLSLERGRVEGVETDQGVEKAGWVVLAAGAWSGLLLPRSVGWLPLQPAKGHSLTVPRVPGVPGPLFFGEPLVVATPLEGRLRLTTGLDLYGFVEGVDRERLRSLEGAGKVWLRGFEAGAAETWYGFRPLTPDGLPLLGPVRRAPNLLLATGHGQLGMTLGPASGELLADLITGASPGEEAAAVSPARFGL